MNCLWCHREIIPNIGWRNVFVLSKQRPICDPCYEKLEYITGPRCQTCSCECSVRQCKDCRGWLKHFNTDDPLTANYSVFHYNEHMQAMMAQWKFRGDYVIGYCFEEAFQSAFHSQLSALPKDIVAIPIPLSRERSRLRKFNQADMLADFLPIKKEQLLQRMDGEKQSKKTRWERLNTRNPFYMSQSIQKPVLLVDDIYTTGTTLRHAASILKRHKCPAVYALTLVRG